MTLPNAICRQINHDPFSIDLNKYPISPGAHDEDESGGVKTIAGRANEAIREEAKKLELQSTMVDGDGGIACINDQLVRKGEKVAGFVVERIEPTRVVLRHGDIQVALALPMN